MILKLCTGVCGKGLDLMPGDLVDWRSKGDCERMVERGLAVEASPEEIKAAGGRVRIYAPPPATAADKWPPAPLKQLKREDD